MKKLDPTMAAGCGGGQRLPTAADRLRPQGRDRGAERGHGGRYSSRGVSPAEKALARTSEGATQVQEFHRQLFKNSADLLRQEIKRITGVAVGEAAAEIETTTGAVVHAFTTGTMVQVFQLAGTISAETWNGSGPNGQSQKTEVVPC